MVLIRSRGKGQLGFLGEGKKRVEVVGTVTVQIPSPLRCPPSPPAMPNNARKREGEKKKIQVDLGLFRLMEHLPEASTCWLDDEVVAAVFP